jgi:hypothetical protein
VIRAVVGLALALIGLVPLGWGVLLLTGTRVRLGLGVFTGMAAAMVLLPPFVYVGLSPTVPLVLALGAVVLALGFAFRRPARPASGRVEPLPLLVLAAPLVLLAARAVRQPVDRYDAFANWTLKAKLLYFGRDFLHASIAPPVHREYPLGLPALEAYVLHCMGSADMRALHVLFVVFLAGLALVAWIVLRPRVDTWPLTAGLSLLLWMPAVRDQALSGYADVPLACLFVSAALLLADERIALAAVFAAAALATKRDALAFCAALYAVALVGAVVRRRRVRPLLLSVCFLVASVLPWRVFDEVRGLRDTDVSPTLSHANELPYTLGQLAHTLVQRQYLWVVPIAAVAALVVLVRGRDLRLALGSVALGLGLLAVLAFVYTSSTSGVHYLVRSTVERTLITPVLLAAALLPLLVTRALAAPREPGSPGAERPRDRGRTRRRARRRQPA